jgi:hypothetical protein
VDSQEGRKSNVAAEFFDDLFLLIYSFLLFSTLPLNSSPTLQPPQSASTMNGSRATPQKFSVGPRGKFSPGGPTLRHRGDLPGNASIKFFGQISPGECLNETVLPSPMKNYRVNLSKLLLVNSK